MLKMKKIKVVNMLATYNEKENVRPMVETLEKIAAQCPEYEFVTLVVDSHSPDGTGEVVRELAKTKKNLFLLETPRGLGVSLIAGYRYAMEELKADIVIPNDCDFQWDPNLIPTMLQKIEEGYDVVVPSRHVKGGKDNFNFFRKLTHFVSNDLLNGYWAGIHEVKDKAGNFKAIRVKNILDKVDLSKLNVRGFVIQSTMIYELSKTKARFVEIPAVFGERRAGESKVGFSMQFVKDIIETFKNSTRIRFERSPGLLKFIKFGIVGGFGFVINFVGLIVFNKLLKATFPWPIGVINFWANALASELAIISNFIWNNLWTFAKEKISSPKMLFTKFLAFNLSSIFGGIIIPSTIVGLGTQFFGDQYRQLILTVAIFGFTVPYNWFVYNKFIWKKQPR
jgi:dolichol-phosphate mannosyltransferase